MNEYKERLTRQIKTIMETKTSILNEIRNELNRINIEKQELMEEKELWRKEKEKICSIQPVEDIVKLNIGGKDDFCVRRSTLCHVKGSALEAMFSGRHKLQNMDDKVFIDRNPFSFNLMIDYIRNHGQLHE